MLLLLSVGNVLTGGFQLSAQEQSKRFSVKVDNITLKEAIEVIKKQGNYSFLIRNNDIDLNRKVSVNINNGNPLAELSQCILDSSNGSIINVI